MAPLLGLDRRAVHQIQYCPLSLRFVRKYLDNILSTTSPYTEEHFMPGFETIDSLESSRVLVIGAGGLGCEILKNLALSGFKDIHVIDMDTIDVSNLNRQFLFRQADVGRPKAEVAAEFVQKRAKGVKITPFCGKIQDKDEDYYMQFGMVICGLDSVEARRWINATLVGMVDMDNPDSLKPLVDGGTEGERNTAYRCELTNSICAGFKGQTRVILPTMTAC